MSFKYVFIPPEGFNFASGLFLKIGPGVSVSELILVGELEQYCQNVSKFFADQKIFFQKNLFLVAKI